MRPQAFTAAALAVLMAATAAWTDPAQAATKKRVVSVTTRQVVERPRARITVRARSFLDAGTEVLPGERKFTDYAYPPNYSPTQVIDYTGVNVSPRGGLMGPFELPYSRNAYPWQWR
jgi:hypothetical protein